jgi:8-oxo-dGTP diphosphatase
MVNRSVQHGQRSTSGLATRTGAGGHHVDEVLAAAPDQVRPHPAVMWILNDAGVARYSRKDIEAGLRRDAITMRVYTFGGAAC